MKPTIVFDFDGVINSYTSGWQGSPENIPDPPVSGVKESIREIRKHYRVVILSSRCSQPGGIAAIEKWLAQYGIEVDLVTDHKPPALVSIDDRAIVFDGHPEHLLEQIKRFKPWHQVR